MEQSGYSITSVYNFLKEADFPASRQDLIDYADENGLPEVIIEKLEHLPDKQYDSILDLLKETAILTP